MLKLSLPPMKQVLALLSALLGLTTLTPLACAQTWPSRPVKIIANFPAGGPLDILARQTAASLTTKLGQAFAVENITGAAGEIGAGAVLRAQPDGHTLLMSIDAPFTIARAMRPQGGSRLDDYAWVCLMGPSGLTVAVHPSTGAKTLTELIAIGRNRELNFSTAGPGSPGHLAAMILADAAGVKATAVHYRGNAPAVTALVGGEVHAGILSSPGVLPHIKAGRLQGLAIAAAARSELLPELPTVAEQGFASLAQETYYVVAFPAKTPASIVASLAEAIQASLSEPESRQRLGSLDITAGFRDGAYAEKVMQQTLERYSRVVKATGMQADR
ncbi:MAG: tripartite tricarboxylate transporter substrate binding protein [Betaproteobacteria bacterium]